MMTSMASGVAALDAGTVFAGDFRVVKPLAEGGMGAVYVVEQLSTGKSRALKLMRPELASDADAQRRFQLEARVGSKIESEHVVEIQSAGIDSATGAPFLVMELLSGEDLSARIRRAGPLTPREAMEVFEQLCHAVGAAHTAGIVHRDLKPENIFLSRSKLAIGESDRPIVKVLDFGIAKLVAEAASTRAMTTGMVGTPLYMAPEQTEAGAITAAADVWALGLILYRALTGRFFWRNAEGGSTYTQLLREVVMGPLPSASARALEQGCAERIPAPLDAVLSMSLVRDPQLRIPDGRAFWLALRRAMAPDAPVPPSSSPSPSRPTPPPPMHAPRLAATTPLSGPLAGRSLSGPLAGRSLSGPLAGRSLSGPLAGRSLGAPFAPTMIAGTAIQSGTTQQHHQEVSVEESVEVTEEKGQRRVRSTRTVRVMMIVTTITTTLGAFVLFMKMRHADPRIAVPPSVATATPQNPALGDPVTPPPPSPDTAMTPDPPTRVASPPPPSIKNPASPPSAGDPLPPASSSACDPPFRIDAQGKKHYKPDCLPKTPASAPTPLKAP
jgi:serine/threonine protein kinase